eukprot:jgi/Galph1/4070/GphlegSOOS_G2724.1
MLYYERESLNCRQFSTVCKVVECREKSLWRNRNFPMLLNHTVITANDEKFVYRKRKGNKRSWLEKLFKFIGKVVLFTFFHTFANKQVKRSTYSLAVGSVMFPGPHKLLFESVWRPILFVSLTPKLIKIWNPALYRTLEFWSRVIPIYIQYKITEKEVKSLPLEERELVWKRRHEWGSEKVYKLCTEMRGFYLKDGQFLGTRADFMPAAWVEKLKTLQDQVPCVSFNEIRKTIESSFGKHVEDIFESIDPSPIASATIAQVHKGTLLKNGQLVAIKAQYADQEQLCKLDLKNLSRLALFLQRHDLKFDLVSVVREFEVQIPLEFDFEREAQMMHRISANLREADILPQKVVIPQAMEGFVSRKVLVMNFIQGKKIMELAKEEYSMTMVNQILENIAVAYGHMLFVNGLFHADPHPGNLVFLEDGRVVIYDFGQVKQLEDSFRLTLCELFEGIATHQEDKIAESFASIGIQVEETEETDELLTLYATGLFDTCPLPTQVEVNPFSEASPLKRARITAFPQQLFMVLRAMQLFRALTSALHSDFSFAAAFYPFAVLGKSIQNSDH